MDNISVIIPTYNRARIVARAVESALAAIDVGDEVIVVDDGSTDDTAKSLRPYFDKIRHVRTDNLDDGKPRNMGTGAGRARNLGVRLATCPLVTFLDDDDEWYRDNLYLQRSVMNSYPKVIFSFSDLVSRRPGGEIVHNILDVWRKQVSVGYEEAGELEEALEERVPFSSISELPAGRSDFKVYMGDLYKATMEAYRVWTCSILVRKSLAGEALRFSEDLHLCEEWECFARLAKLGPVAYLDCELAIQDLHTGTRNTDVGLYQLATDRITMLHRVWGGDESFMGVNAACFRNVLRAQHLERAKYLIKEGRSREAREDLDIAGDAPWPYRLLTRIPSPLVRAMLSIRRRLQESSRNRRLP